MEIVRCLLMIIFTLTVLACSPTLARPLSWSKSARYRRSPRSDSSATPTPTLSTDNAGIVHENVAGLNFKEMGGASETNCMQQCYENGSFPSKYPPQNKISELMEHSDALHPSLTLSIWLENYRRREFCSSTSMDGDGVNCEADEPQNVQDINEEVLAMADRLSTNEETYSITYNELNYPRYLAQVECKDGTESIKRPMKYLAYFSEQNEWKIVENPDVTVGCKCSNTFDYCMETCYDSSAFPTKYPTQENITNLMEDDDAVHPSLILSLWLENYHRREFCDSANTDSNGINCEENERQNVDDINTTVLAMAGLLNVTNSNEEVIQGYSITYNENHYPRYLAQVECKNGLESIRKSMRYLAYSSADSVWKVYVNSDVTVGCQCSTS